MGDGALVEFAQRRRRRQRARWRSRRRWPRPSRTRREGERIRYRIGINLGDVIVEGDDIYGDGVNVAARLQALAPPGGVALSRNVRDQVDRQDRVPSSRIWASTRCKNIERPVHVFAVRPARGAVGACGDARQRARVHLRAAVRQHERRPGAGVLLATASARTSSPTCPRFRRCGSPRATPRSRSRASTSTCRRSRGSSRSATCSKAACARPGAACGSRRS